ncbi:MAG: DUF3999 family protein [Bryobacteraceae bacterium]
MRKIRLVVCVVCASWGALRAQAPGTPEPLGAWPYFKEIQPPHNYAGLLDFVLDREVLDQARANQSDLRLYDSAGREIPYARRVRREVETQNTLTAREFNRGTEGGAVLVSCDLGEQVVQHNEVEIETAGNNFRRLADVEGSLDGIAWSKLASDAILFRFAAGGRTVEQQAVDYPVSRYRYLRVRVNRDPQVDRAALEIVGVRIRRSVHMKGEMVGWTAILEGREADRVDGRPASVWRMDLGARVPLERLAVTIAGESFSRPFQLEGIDDPAAPVMIASGELARREGAGAAPLSFDFSERFARRLKLTVIDDRNEPLPISAINAMSVARQVVFALSPTAAAPLRLYYGAARALEPRYDMAARLPADLSSHPPIRLALGPQRDNPVYRPEPQPFSERAPWLVYVVLAAASLALAAILISLARASAKSAPAL